MSDEKNKYDEMSDEKNKYDESIMCGDVCFAPDFCGAPPKNPSYVTWLRRDSSLMSTMANILPRLIYMGRGEKSTEK